jgi:hypothetical protein
VNAGYGFIRPNGFTHIMSKETGNIEVRKSALNVKVAWGLGGLILAGVIAE